MPPISRPGSSHYYVTPSFRQRRFSELPLPSMSRRFEPQDVSSSEVSSRHYIDPWDLENYAYMERHYTDEYVTPTPALESSQSDFYYVPNYPGSLERPASVLLQDESIGLFAGVEEEDFYNERYKTYNKSPSPVNDCYQSYTDVTATRFKPPAPIHQPHKAHSGDSYEEDSITTYSDDYRAPEFVNPRLNYELYSPSVMLRKPPNPHEGESTSLVYVYEAGSRKRKMALPKGNFRFERRRSLRDSYRSHQQTSDDCYVTDLSDDLMSVDESSITNYDDFCFPNYNEEDEIYSSNPVPKYQLSKYGHLKIDYSFSWNSLGRYIGAD